MKYPNILQQSEEDCGAACIASIAKKYGRIFNINRIREAVGTGQLGTTLLGLKQGAEVLGFHARAVRASPEILDRINEVPLPAIVHWKGYHWVVLYGKRGRKYIISDPAVGILYLSKSQLAEYWTDWVMLLLEPDPGRFWGESEDRSLFVVKFGQILRPYSSIIGEALIINLFVGLVFLSTPFLIQVLTDEVLVRNDTNLLTGLTIAVVVMNLIGNSLRLVQSNLVAHFAQRLELNLVLEFGRQILRLPLSYYESRRSGEIVSRLRDIQQINQLVSQVLINLPSQLFVAVVSLALMIFYSWKLAVCGACIGLMMTLSTWFFLPVLKQRVRNLLVLEAENQGVLVETFKGAQTLKTISAAPQFWEELQSRFGRLAKINFRTVQLAIINNTFSELIGGIGVIFLLWFGSYLVIQKELTIGQLLAFNVMNANFVVFITNGLGFVDDFMRVKTATERIAEVIDATPEREGEKNSVTIPDNANIYCKNVAFNYPGRAEVIKDFSIEIPGGKVIAIVGKSGCGKSTIAKLIAGLYPIQSGNIRIGIYNLADISLNCLRKQVVLVPQEAHFWSRSIIENFRLGDARVTFERIVKACQIAEADYFISNLPEKYETVLGEFGANLSGGQKQRLAIARAIVNDPPVLILDESTAGLDPVSEGQVLAQLLANRPGKTTILISHRPRVINRADWVVYLEEGNLKIQGSIEELRSHPGDHLDFLNP